MLCWVYTNLHIVASMLEQSSRPLVENFRSVLLYTYFIWILAIFSPQDY
jgi:hypothetical protein